MRRRGVDADFRATGQTGIMIAGSGMPMDAVVSDFVAGAAEMLSPDAAPDHWDVIEGQGSLFHPAYAGVSLGLLHGSQPDVIVVCHEPGREHLLGYPDFPTPSLPEAIARHLAMGSLTNREDPLRGRQLQYRRRCGRARRKPLMQARRASARPAGRGPDARRRRLRATRRVLPRLVTQPDLVPAIPAARDSRSRRSSSAAATPPAASSRSSSCPSVPGAACSPWRSSTVLFSLICVVTFLFARMTRQHGLPELLPQPRRAVLGRCSRRPTSSSFILILAVYGAAAGAIGAAHVRLADRSRACSCLMASIAAFTAFGNRSVEWLFKYVSFFLYGVYALFVFFSLQPIRHRGASQGLCRSSANDRLGPRRHHLHQLQHDRRRRDPAGPAPPDQHARRGHRRACSPDRSTMIPALLFFLCMMAWYPAIGAEVLPADFMLRQLGLPLLHVAFQLMIFTALLQSGVSAVHAINERIAGYLAERHQRDVRADSRGSPARRSCSSPRSSLPSSSGWSS